MSRLNRTLRLGDRGRLREAEKRRQQSARRLVFERLEERRLLAATEPSLVFLQQSVDMSNRSSHSSDAGQPVVYLYSDYWSGGTYGDLQASAMTLDGNDPDAGHGVTSLRATWDGSGANGWYQFWLGDGQPNRPRDIPEFGLARSVRFLAKGDTAGQDIHARIFKVTATGGWQQVKNQAVDLSTAWQDFAVDLSGLNLAPHDLHAVQFVIGDGINDGGRTFWVDEVRIGTDGFDPLRVPVSYRAQFGDPAGGDLGYRDAQIYPNHSFLYDSALTVKALLAAGDADSVQMARDVTDALLATKLADGAYSNDRNCGHVLLEDGTPRAAFSDKRTLGDQAWFGLALLDVYRQTGDANYLDRAVEISDWAESSLKDTGAWKGYRGGYDPDGNAYAWRSTEHNIDLFALNRGIAVLLGLRHDAREADFVTRATHAGDFVMNMFDPVGGKFWTGTGAGDAVNTSSVPLDAQTWALLTLARFPQYAEQIDWRRVMDWVEDHLQACDSTLCGLTYSDQSTPDVVWLEGTAQAAVVARLWREGSDGDFLIGELEKARTAHPHADGYGIVAASRDSLLDVPLGAVYDARLHAGATAWTYFATAGVNPLLPQLDIPDQTQGLTFVVDDWNNKVTETDLGHNDFAGNSGAIESVPNLIEIGLSDESSGLPGGSLDVEFNFTGAPANSFTGAFSSLFGLTDTLVSLDGSGVEPPAPTPFPGYYLDMTDVYRGFANLADRRIDRMQLNTKLLSPQNVTVKIQLQDEAGFDVFTRRTLNAGADWETLSIAVPDGFDRSLAGHGDPAGFDWRRVSVCAVIVERENVGDGIVNPDTGRFLMDNLKLIDAGGAYPDVEAAADLAGLGLNPYFEESFLNLVRATSSQYFVDWASTDSRTGGMIQDRSTFADLMTVGGAGFQLTSYVVDAREGYLPRPDAAARTLSLLRVLHDHPQGPARVGTIGHQGFFYHFLGIDGLRKQNFDFVATPEDESQNTVELSSIDTGLVLAGVVTAGQYFDGADAVEAEIRQLADAIYARVDFHFMVDPASHQFYLGWKPNETRDDTGKWGRFLLDDAEGAGQYSSKPGEGGEVPATIDFYTDEGLLLALLAMGTPNPAHRLGREVWDAMIRAPADGEFVRTFPGALFTYEFGSVWLDTNRLGQDNHPAAPLDFFANTRSAVTATRAYVAQNPLDRATWKNDSRLWALSAADGPLDAYHAYAAPTAALARHAGGLGGVVTAEAEAGTGDGLISMRSNASNQQTVLLSSGQSRSLSVNLPCAGTYELTVRYSNDNFGPLETVAVSVDGTPVGTFQAQDTGDFGAGWNVFVTANTFGLWPSGWDAGNHQILVTVSGGDGYGVEIDCVTLDLVQPLEDGTVAIYASGGAVLHDWFGATDSLWRAAELDLLHPRFGYADAYNADVADALEAVGVGEAECAYQRCGGAWANFTGFSIDHGPLALMIDNYLSHNFVPELFMNQTQIQEALRTVFPDYGTAGGDIVLQQATAYGDASLELSYEILGGPVAALEVAVYRSADPLLDPTDVRLDQTTLSNPADLAAGSHVKTLAIGTGPAELALPGAGAEETDTEYYLLVCLDPLNAILENDADALLGDNTTPFSGVYHPAGGEVYVHGTLGDDVVAVASGSLQLAINGVPLSYDLATVTGLRVRGHAGDDELGFDAGGGFATTPPLPVYVHGGAGSNQLNLWDSTGDDVLKLYPARAEMSGPGYVLNAEAASRIEASAAGGGNDDVRLYDSAEDDRLVSRSAYVYLEGAGFYNYVQGFGKVSAYATAGGLDKAQVFDSAGDDKFVSRAASAYIEGPGYFTYMAGFDEVSAYATVGGTDTAILFDTAGDDRFISRRDYSYMQGPGYLGYAAGFETVSPYATAGGVDTAVLFDSPGDDLFVGQPGYAYLEGPGFLSYVAGFDEVTAYATAGGTDKARFFDGAGDDVFVHRPTTAYIRGAGFYHYVQGFGDVKAYSTAGGVDRAMLFDSAGNDKFVGRPNYSYLEGPGYLGYVAGFAEVKAYSTAGGTDTAMLFDSAGDDVFVGRSAAAYLQGPGYLNYASGFGSVSAYATAGGTDEALLFDSAGDDHLTGAGNWYELSYDLLDVLVPRPTKRSWGQGFDRVVATSNQGGYDTLDVEATDYLFEQFEDWQ